MADITLTDRLQPSLLDRLTDQDPDSLKETRDSRVIDIRRLRDIIQRDLSWLLNTNNNESGLDPVRYPNVAHSVLNYGVREVAGEFSSVEKAEQIRLSVLRAIERFEPRLEKGSCEVEFRASEGNGDSVVTFDIRAFMWAQPLPMELYLRSQTDITTGEFKLERKM
jgi:type VI secretion system protein ImpF